MGLLLPLSKGTVLFEREGTHMCVFLCPVAFLMLLPASLGLRHHLNYINVHNLKRYSEASYSYQHCTTIIENGFSVLPHS